MSDTLTAECRRCVGEGVVFSSASFHDCPDCGGEGWINCDRGGVCCPFKHCYCESAWDREQQSKMEDF